MRHLARRLTFVALSSLVAASACRRGAAETAPTGPVVSEGNIVAIVLAANNTDLSYARLVPSRSNHVEIRSFAERMTTDHTLLNARVNEIAGKNRITAEDHVISLDFRDNSANRRDAMRELEGAKFDSAYAENEVKYHTELLAALRTVLEPQSRTPELLEFVRNLTPAVMSHLSHAERIRASLATRK